MLERLSTVWKRNSVILLVVSLAVGGLYWFRIQDARRDVERELAYSLIIDADNLLRLNEVMSEITDGEKATEMISIMLESHLKRLEILEEVVKKDLEITERLEEFRGASAKKSYKNKNKLPLEERSINFPEGLKD